MKGLKSMTAQKILKKAISQIGVKENPSGSNNVKYNTDYYGKAVSGSAYPWCCAFVWWIFKECGASHLFYDGKKTAYCPTVETFYKSKGQWYTNNPKVGDLVLFDFSGKGVAGHIGILEKINADGTYTTIEGNTSTSNQANGGCVMRRTRKKSTIRGFARPDYGTVSKTETVANNKGGNTVTVTLTVLRKGSKGNEVKTLQRLLNALGYNLGNYGERKDGVDGDFGARCDTAVRAFQKASGLTVDGVVGQATWTKLLK